MFFQSNKKIITVILILVLVVLLIFTIQPQTDNFQQVSRYDYAELTKILDKVMAQIVPITVNNIVTVCMTAPSLKTIEMKLTCIINFKHYYLYLKSPFNNIFYYWSVLGISPFDNMDEQHKQIQEFKALKRFGFAFSESLASALVDLQNGYGYHNNVFNPEMFRANFSRYLAIKLMNAMINVIQNPDELRDGVVRRSINEIDY